MRSGEIMNDLKFALRQLAKNPGFTAVAVLTIAICLVANLAIFAVIDSVLVRNLPFPSPDQLETMFRNYPKSHVERHPSRRDSGPRAHLRSSGWLSSPGSPPGMARRWTR
jgi:hypothetical protein